MHTVVNVSTSAIIKTLNYSSFIPLLQFDLRSLKYSFICYPLHASVFDVCAMLSFHGYIYIWTFEQVGKDICFSAEDYTNLSYYNDEMCGTRSKHSNIKKRGDLYIQTFTGMQEVDRNKYFTLNRCPNMTNIKKRTNQIRYLSNYLYLLNLGRVI